MNLTDIAIPLTGDLLMEAMIGAKSKRKVIVEGLLYEGTMLMIAADPGVGKSTISTQVAIELASGQPIFGYFNVPEPVKIFYIQTERSIMELLERIEVISKTLPIIKENIIITDEYQKLNLLNPEHANIFIKSMKRDYDGAKVIFIDPIYATVLGGLKEDKQASVFTKAMSMLQKELGCVMWYNHHTVKPQYSSSSGDKIDKDDPFYGSQWLKAHVTGSYYMKKTNNGVILVCKKDNYKILTEEIPLEYNPETELSYLLSSNLSSENKLRNFLEARKIDKKEFYFKDIQVQTGLCIRTLRKLTLHSMFVDNIIVVSDYKNKKLYKMRDEK